MTNKSSLSAEQEATVKDWVSRAYVMHSNGQEDELNQLFVKLENEDQFTETMYLSFERQFVHLMNKDNPIFNMLEAGLRARRGREGRN